MALELGEVLEGKVTGVKKFGAFVRLSCGTTGMVHISEVSSEYIQELSDVLSEGQQVKVKVLSIGDDGKVGLSIKKAMDLPPAKKERPPKPARADTGRVWQPKPAASSANLSFEDMMSRYKSQSEEKISDLRRVTEARRGGGGYSRRR